VDNGYTERREEDATTSPRSDWRKEEMAPAGKTKTVSCPFSLTKRKSSLVTSRMMNFRMFETPEYIGLTRLSALPSV
jgi:hypothetical protein